jgi:hypothetical protein
MTGKYLIDRYLAGELLGDIIGENCINKLVIKRKLKKESMINSVLIDACLLHTTDGYVRDKKVGSAKTFLIGDLEEWQHYKSIRMNQILNRFGYYISNCSMNKDKSHIKRTITSTTLFGQLIIKEKVFINELLFATRNNKWKQMN